MSRYDDWKLTETPKKPMPQCPVCGCEAKEFYVDTFDHGVLGCEECAEAEDSDGHFCEVCGEPCEELFYFRGELHGCDRCVETVDAVEWREDHG